MSIHHTTGRLPFQMSTKVDHIHIPMYNNKRDGSGRDCYVGTANGGNTLQYSPLARGFADGNDPSNRFKFKVGAHGHIANPQAFFQNNSPVAPQKINYRQDGTGRDSYIFLDNGGFYPEKELAVFRQTFNEKLRTGQMSSKQTTYDYLLKRNRRMKSFLSTEKQLELMLASQCGHNRHNDPFAATNGFLV